MALRRVVHHGAGNTAVMGAWRGRRHVRQVQDQGHLALRRAQRTLDGIEQMPPDVVRCTIRSSNGARDCAGRFQFRDLLALSL